MNEEMIDGCPAGWMNVKVLSVTVKFAASL